METAMELETTADVAVGLDPWYRTRAAARGGRGLVADAVREDWAAWFNATDRDRAACRAARATLADAAGWPIGAIHVLLSGADVNRLVIDEPVKVWAPLGALIDGAMEPIVTAVTGRDGAAAAIKAAIKAAPVEDRRVKPAARSKRVRASGKVKAAVKALLAAARLIKHASRIDARRLERALGKLAPRITARLARKVVKVTD